MSDGSGLDAYLPAGMNEEAFVGAVASSGYPLQMYAARVLKDYGFWMQEEWAYTDRDSDQRRAIDILAGTQGTLHSSDAGESSVATELLIECKRSAGAYVFFEAVNPPRQNDYPSPIYRPGRIMVSPAEDRAVPNTWVREATVAAVLDLAELPFVAETPVAASMSVARAQGNKVQISGDEAYRELLLPLSKAGVEHRLWRRRDSNDEGQYQSLDVPFLVAVLDAPMFLVRLPEARPEPIQRLRMFVRAAVEPEGRRFAHEPPSFIEVVHKSAFAKFIEEDLVEFMSEVERRINAHHRVILSGRAEVHGLTSGELLAGGIMERLA